MNRFSLLLLFFIILAAGCQQKELLQQATLKKDPDSVKLITSDIELFWEMYDAEIPLYTAMELKEQYVDAGTPALSYYYQKQIKKPEVYTGLLNSWIDRQYYEDVRGATLDIASKRDQIIDAFKAFKKIYPDAVFTDIVFVMGALNSGGVVLPNGQIVIAAEMFSRNNETDVDYLNQWLQSVLQSPEYLPVIAVHELVHLQQQRSSKIQTTNSKRHTLLELALLEGSADFITYLVLDKSLNDHLQSYANPIENKLWNQFRKSMNRRNLSKWLYNGSTVTQTPADLGYYIGFRIAQHYYSNAADKQQAVKEMIEMKDSRQFLEDSGYADAFK